MTFTDRRDGGRQLAARLVGWAGRPNLVVVGLPRGGVPVADEVARALEAPLDVIVVRKLGVPFQPELAMGAIGEDGVRYVNDDIVEMANITRADLAAVETRERKELERRAHRFRGERSRRTLAGADVIVVDDGVATGSTARAACEVARAEGAARVTLAVPVAPRDWTERLAGVADELIAVVNPPDFRAVGQFYADFAPTSDAEVIEILAAASDHAPHPDDVDECPEAATADRPPLIDADVVIRVGSVEVAGHLRVPASAHGLVIFAHGSGSSRHSPRNQFVAGVLGDAGFATLLFDLLSPHEELERSNVFDIELLGARLVSVARWAAGHPELSHLPMGYFGASTGAAAALWAASAPTCAVAAVVSRGGRPDLAATRLSEVRAPTRLIVGSDDHAVLRLNRQALELLTTERDLVVVPGATHLFEEPGTLRAAAEAARDWFLQHLVAGVPAA